MRSVNDVISLIADRTMMGNDEWSMRLDRWDWNPGVGMYGLWAACEATGRKDIYDFLVRWVDTYGGCLYETQTINSIAPMLTVLELYIKTRDEKYKTLCQWAARWLTDKAARTCDGGFEHTVTEDVAFSGQMWADTLFMACIFLARYGRVTRDEECLALALHQLYLHHNYLKDRQTGLFYHGWDGTARNFMSGAIWGRANAWITAATVEILECTGLNSGEARAVMASLEEQLQALKKYQRENGSFGTVITEVKSYDETSAAAGISCGISRGIDSGLLGREYLPMAEKAFQYTLSRINERGEAEGVSGGTPVMPALKDYYTIPCYPSLYGQGLALLALCRNGGGRDERG